MAAKTAKASSTRKSAKRAASSTAMGAVEGARERILATARDLIYREGARAVGVDRIVAESGVAKMSLYRWFPSKDELIAAVLDEERRRIVAVWDHNMERYRGNPLQQLRAQFESLAEAMRRPAYRGCAFLNAALAFADEDHPARAVVREFKLEIIRRFTELATAIGAKNPKLLAEQLSLLTDGVHASSQAVGKDGPCVQMLVTADALIAAQLPAKQQAR
jgi:AcrR family transcriptional regulator